MNIIKKTVIQFIIMLIVGIIFNPMNILAYNFSDLYLSLTLVYSGLLMAANMMWSHEILHYLTINHYNKYIFIIGIILSIMISIFCLDINYL